MMELMLKNSLTHGLDRQVKAEGINPMQPASLSLHEKFHEGKIV